MSPRIPPTVVTGSATQVPPEIARQLGIRHLPRKFMSMETYRDGIDLVPNWLYQKDAQRKIGCENRSAQCRILSVFLKGSFTLAGRRLTISRSLEDKF